MIFWNRNKKNRGIRIIKTARDKKSINEGAKKGYMPLVKKVESSEDIRSKFSVIQNKKTGEIEVLSDYRMDRSSINDGFETVIDWTFYYPYQFKSPFAAYLLPIDIQIGERVLIEDLIEDFIGSKWNQGDTYRLQSCEAIWNGQDLEIQYDPRGNRSDIVS